MRSPLPRAIAGVAVIGLGVVACAPAPSTEPTASDDQELTACRVALDEEADAVPMTLDGRPADEPYDQGDYVDEEDGDTFTSEPAGGIHGTGCDEIEIKDPRKPPKHPPLPIPLPKDWCKRKPAYGPPKKPEIDPKDDCKGGKNPTQIKCELKIDKTKVKFNCMRHAPGGKEPANGGKCEFHCYVDM